jgi:hypothetical protein
MRRDHSPKTLTTEAERKPFCISLCPCVSVVKPQRFSFKLDFDVRLLFGNSCMSTHLMHGHRKAASFGKMMCPQCSQIMRPLGRTFIGRNV